MSFVGISKWPMGSDAFRAPQKTICNPEPDGPSGPGTTKLVQRSGDPPKLVPGSLTDPLDAAVAPLCSRGCLGCGRASSQLKTVGSGLGQTCQNRTLDAVPVAGRPNAAKRRASRDASDPRWVV